jgi:hypothetical protein
MKEDDAGSYNQRKVLAVSTEQEFERSDEDQLAISYLNALEYCPRRFYYFGERGFKERISSPISSLFKLTLRGAASKILTRNYTGADTGCCFTQQRAPLGEDQRSRAFSVAEDSWISVLSRGWTRSFRGMRGISTLGQNRYTSRHRTASLPLPLWL